MIKFSLTLPLLRDSATGRNLKPRPIDPNAVREYGGVLIRHGAIFRYLNADAFLEAQSAFVKPLSAAALAHSQRAAPVAKITANASARAEFDPLDPSEIALGRLSELADNPLHVWPSVLRHGALPVMTMYVNPAWGAVEMVRKVYRCPNMDVVYDFAQAKDSGFTCPNHGVRLIPS